MVSDLQIYDGQRCASYPSDVILASHFSRENLSSLHDTTMNDAIIQKSFLQMKRDIGMANYEKYRI